ncbi:MAG TPA: putative toxin-antitoxin system toxin component, PIN family [Steroidobacteraceae bacterium]|nr:putative toxin-antitoxin system toxin component, PIN family [Steroidobacteraceae bacterium]
MNKISTTTEVANVRTAVLDTNVVLDWLVFRDPSTLWLPIALRTFPIPGSGLRLMTSAAALTELQNVLAYARLGLSLEDQRTVLDMYRQQAMLVEPQAPAGLPRCRDADDQHFLELAVFAQADVLISRDKALLKLRSRMKKFGVQVVDAREAERTFASLASGAAGTFAGEPRQLTG